MKGKGREASIPLERTVSVHVKHHETRDEAIDRARPIDTMIRLAQDLGDMYMSFADASTGVDDWTIGVDQGFKDDLLQALARFYLASTAAIVRVAQDLVEAGALEEGEF